MIRTENRLLACAARNRRLVGRAATPRERLSIALSRQLFGVLFVAASLVQAQTGADTDVKVIHVQGNVHMLVGPNGNTAIQAGPDGILLVDTQLEAQAPKVLAEARKLSTKPLAWIVNTSADPEHSAGNAALTKLGTGGAGQRTRVIAHENVLGAMTAAKPPIPQAVWPNDEYATPFKDISFNGEAVVIYHVPAAHTDGDSLVHFRRSDVLATGDLFTPGRYPVIDLERGGSVQGLIDALNRILQITVPLKYQEGGTYVIPGHGRVCDEADVVEFRDMLTIIRDRVQDSLQRGMSLQQVKDSKPTRDYDTEYRTAPGWTVDRFVEAIYKSLSEKK
jgi:glyoxylase-like metal-dependent hydrolase (beta-lactamase superfamily II)